MRLKSIDKYIKDKLQGYKPAYDEALWQGVQEKLPSVSGRSTWLWPAAAVLAAAVMVPFVVKFYNITGQTAERAQNNRQEMAAAKVQQNQSATSSAIAGIHAEIEAGKTVSPALENNGKDYAAALAYSHGNTGSEMKQGLHHGIQNSRTSLLNEGISGSAAGTAIAAGQNNTGSGDNKAANMNADGFNGIMDFMKPELTPLENNPGPITINKDDQIDQQRYINRRGHNLTYSKWNNWQSIFYPFWLNPAYTGSEGKVNITVDDRMEFVAEPKTSFNVINFGAEYSFYGFGVGFYHNQSATMSSIESTNGFALSKAVLHMGTTSVKIGASVSFISNSLFFNTLNYSDQINPTFGFINPTQDKNIAQTSVATGINGGIWINNPHVMGGLDVVNINKPHIEHLPEAQPLPREYRATLGYRFGLSPTLQFMPMTIITRQNQQNQANGMLTAVYRDKYMLTLAYENIDPLTGKGNASVYAGVIVKKDFRIFISYGDDIDKEELGISDVFFHAGIKYQIR